jgi:hypothetical protein
MRRVPRSRPVRMLQHDVDNLGRLERYIASPQSKSSMPIHGFRPLGQRRTLRPVLRRVFALDFQRQGQTVLQSNDEVREIASARALPEIADMEG